MLAALDAEQRSQVVEQLAAGTLVGPQKDDVARKQMTLRIAAAIVQHLSHINRIGHPNTDQDNVSNELDKMAVSKGARPRTN